MGNSIKLLAIKTKDKVYISDNTERKTYYSGGHNISPLLFDGKKCTGTYQNDWYQIDKWPEKVQKVVPGGKVNYRWKLKAGFPVSELMPEEIKDNPNDEDSEYNQVSGLYTVEYDTLPEVLEDVEIEWEILADMPQFTPQNPIYTIQSNLIDKITTTPILLTERPCKVTGGELYRLLRAKLKQSIDGRYARITSDYDFSLEVKKCIAYHNPVKYTVTEGKGRKERSVTKWQSTKEVSVLKYGDGSKGYGSYPEAISADNYKELEQKVNQWLDDMLKLVNEPVKECPHCAGSGMTLTTADTLM